MNAAIRAAVRVGTGLGFEMFGIRHGFNGLIEGDIIPLDNRAVGGIIERGGTFLYTARSREFLTSAGQEKALATIARASGRPCHHRRERVAQRGTVLRGARGPHSGGPGIDR